LGIQKAGYMGKNVTGFRRGVEFYAMMRNIFPLLEFPR